MRVGLLTGGGDCPGLNAVIRAVVRKGERHYGDELVGFRDGWKGVLEDSTMVLDARAATGKAPNVRAATVRDVSSRRITTVIGVRGARVDLVIRTDRVTRTDRAGQKGAGKCA